MHYLSFSTHCSTQKSDETADRTKVNQMLLTVLLLASAIHGAIADVADVANVADVEVRTTRFHNGSSLTHFVICLSSCHQSYKWKEDLTDLLFSGRTIRVIIIQMPYWIPLIVQTLGKTTGIIGILTRFQVAGFCRSATMDGKLVLLYFRGPRVPCRTRCGSKDLMTIGI